MTILAARSLASLASLAALASLALVAGCSGEAIEGDPGGFPSAPLTTVTSDSGALTIAVRTSPTQPPGRGSITVEYTITADGAADEMTLAVVPWMPSMGHGASTEPTVAAMGGGRFVVSGVDLFMPGRWELRTTTSGSVDDSAIIPLQIP